MILSANAVAVETPYSLHGAPRGEPPVELAWILIVGLTGVTLALLFWFAVQSWRGGWNRLPQLRHRFILTSCLLTGLTITAALGPALWQISRTFTKVAASGNSSFDAIAGPIARGLEPVVWASGLIFIQLLLIGFATLSKPVDQTSRPPSA